MERYTNPMTAQSPSGFAMPACGHAAFAPSYAGLGTTTAVRERSAAVFTDGVKGDLGLAAAVIPGTTAWSPPLS